ncbi:uncharacterized protein [Physcomitrium patens]|uniref:Uncharacterized protein n=1 Tax=Physcomitrium patens TaxID=3218 RepID=A0A2K1IY04_PHYPA|nr:uncharacterized protein LOC112272803 [Physcomitrium patens]PNR34147.1 hypothetical protein PHYPA_023964 [Physcomitrium patens]|eukprot:XP_024356685.1 uncharacterized protein LOC112272803 [Physcomitrella patens]
MIMDVTSVNGTPTAKKFGGGGSPACTNPKNLTKWAALIASLVILLHSSSTGVYAARSFGDAISSSDVLVLYKSGSESSRVHKLRSATNTENVEFGHFLERKLLQVQPPTNTRPLAVRGDRRDPTNGFRKYRRGYDVKSKSYWASAIYTGVYGFSIAVAWLLLGLLLVLAAICKLCCCRREKVQEPRSSFYYWLPRLLVLLLSLFAIGCIITLFVRNEQFHTQAFNVRDTIRASSNDATGAVRNVSSTLSEVDTLVSRYGIAGLERIGQTVTSLNQQAETITTEVDNTLSTLTKLINGIEIALIIILAVALFLVIAGLVTACIGWRALLFLILLLGWILTALTWVLFGLFFAVNNVASDTCQAFTEYLQAPANTTLDDLLPCVDLSTASSASGVAKQGVSNIIVQANGAITQIRDANTRIGRNTSLPDVCNPIGPAPTHIFTNSCPRGTISIGELPQAIQPYVCPEEPLSNTCLAEGRVVTPTQGTTIRDFSQGGQSLLNIIPQVDSLTNCSFVYDTFNTIVNERCSPARRAIRNLWIPLLLLSIALTLITISWILANHRNKKERYSHTIHAQDSPRPTQK